MWEGKIPKVKYDKLIQRYERLGLKLCDLEIKSSALKAMWPLRWVDRSDIQWFYHRLPIKDERIWECNTDSKDIHRMLSMEFNQFSVVGSIRAAWAEYNYQATIEDPEVMLGSILWGSSLIRQKGQPIFSKEVVDSNIDKVLDIYDVMENRFMTFEQVCNNFGYVLSCLKYLGIVAAIPKIWKITLRNVRLHQPIDIPNRLHSLCEK